MEDILLSICISSYNRGTKCAELVRSILKIEDERYNIFICDDCSDREDVLALQSLQNSKIVLIKNKKNVGACLNWYRTINSGNGKYILHVLDRDDISVNDIIRLLDILENCSIAGGYVGTSAITLTHAMSENADYEILEKGREAFTIMAGVPIHPTGFLVNRVYWQEGKYRKFFCDQAKFGIYPHSYVLGELARQANMLYMPVAFWTSLYRGCNRHSRFYAKSGQKDYWWLPDSVIKAANCLLLYLYPLAGDEYKEEFLCNRLREGIYRSTIGYRNTAATQSEMHRYGLKAHSVPKVRLLLVILKYKIIFRHILNKLDSEKQCNRFHLISIWNEGINNVLRVV